MIEDKERSYILSGVREWDGINDDYTFEHAKWRTEFRSKGPERDGWVLFHKTIYQLVKDMEELNDKGRRN